MVTRADVNVQIRLHTSDLGVCGDSVRQLFRASVTTRGEDGSWKLVAMTGRRTYGHAPQSDADACGSVLDDGPSDAPSAPDDESGESRGATRLMRANACPTTVMTTTAQRSPPPT